MIVRAAGAADVARAVRLANATGMELAVRSGGHSLAGYGTVDDGIVVDMTALKGLHIDPDRRLAWAGAGLTAREYTAAAAAHGLATPFGDTGSVGIAGLTLGGGIGWLVRKYGLAIDALRAVEIVTADGRILTASADEHPDLFWAVRGGGGNFGIVTRFQYELYPVDGIFGGALFMPATRDVLRSLVPIASSAPGGAHDHLLPHAHPADAVRAGGARSASCRSRSCSCTPATRPTAPRRSRRSARWRRRSSSSPCRCRTRASTRSSKGPSSAGFEVTRSRFLDTIDDGAVDAMLEAMADRALADGDGPDPRPRWRDGAGSRPTRPPSSIATRPSWWPSSTRSRIPPRWTSRSPGPRRSTRRSRRTPSACTRTSSSARARIGSARPIGASTYQRLSHIKRRYDPTNLFHLNQNIPPAGSI